MSLQIVNGSNQPQQYQTVRQTNFNGANPLLRNTQAIDEFELERNLDTKEGQLAFLKYHYEKAKGSQGWISRGFNKLKNWTGQGLSTSKLDAEIAAFMNGQVPFEKVCEDINKFKYNQKEATEVLVDTASAAVSFTASHVLTNLTLFSSALCRKNLNKGKFLNLVTGALIGGGFKAWTKLFDSFGVEKSQRKENRHFFKDMFTGSIAGASGALPGTIGSKPLPMIGSVMGGIMLNSGIRYMTLPKENKSFEDFFHQQIENPGIKLVATAALGTLAACNYKNLSEWEKVAEKSNKKIENVTPLHVEDIQTSFEALAGENGINVFATSKENSIGSILQKCKDENKGVTETLEMLEQKNMFYPKYLQTLPNNFADTLEGEDLCTKFPMLPKIIELVKSECTGARTESDAQSHINELFGDGKYTIIKPTDKKTGEELEAKPLGVGSVAETWLVKDKDGKEYVVKMVKPGVSKANLENQKKELEEQIKGTDEQSQANKKCLENLFNTWEKELDLKAESESATTLANGVKQAHVVKPIETCQDGTAYVMEKAEGQLFSHYLAYERLKDSLGIDGGCLAKRYMAVNTEYTNLYFEQIFSVPRKGDKVVHADPHPGNIFISSDEKGKPVFTFIDTGNVIRMSNKEAVQNLYAHLNYFVGNTEGIAANLLKGAKYPDGMDEKKAIEGLKKELDTKFYNGHTYFEKGIMNLFNIFNTIDTLATNWMEKNKIISNPNNTNMHKAEYTYSQNFNAMNPSQYSDNIYNILDKYRNGLTIDVSSITEEDKTQLIALYRLTFDNTLKEIKNIGKLINEKSQGEYLKPKVLFKKYIDAIITLKAMSIFKCDDSLVTNAYNELNENVDTVYKAISTYNQDITDTDAKQLADKSYKVYYNTFAKIKAQNFSQITNDDLGYDKDSATRGILNLTRSFNGYKFESEYKKDLDEIKKQEEDYKKKTWKKESDYCDDTVKEILTHPVKSLMKMYGKTIQSGFSSMFYHPFNSLHEVVQFKKYLDQNKEHAMNTLNLIIHGKNMSEDAKKSEDLF